MASPFDNRVVTPILSSLSHLCVIKVALPLWQDVGQPMLAWAFDNIQRGEPMEYLEIVKGRDRVINTMFRAHKNLLPILPHLRKKVIESVDGLEFEASEWRCDHKYISILKDKFPNKITHISWRSDGTIDRMKTAQCLVRDTDIDIRTRFEVACNYCLVETIHTLWTQLEISRNTEDLNLNRCMVSFWVRRIRDGLDDSWPHAALEYLESHRRSSYFMDVACCRSIFPLLQGEDRQRFLVFFQFANLDDMRCCLYIMTKEEQEQLLTTCALKVLRLYFKQPLRSFFLATAKKIWNYIDETKFRCLLNDILGLKIISKHFKDFDSIVEDVWNMGSDNFRVRARENPYFRGKIDSFFNEMREKRKAEDEMNEQMRKKVRSDADGKK